MSFLSSIPWNPATITILPLSNSFCILSVLMYSILSFPLSFEVKIPERTPLDISALGVEALNAELEKGYEDMKAERTKEAKSVFADIRKDYGIWFLKC